MRYVPCIFSYSARLRLQYPPALPFIWLFLPCAGRCFGIVLLRAVWGLVIVLFMINVKIFTSSYLKTPYPLAL